MICTYISLSLFQMKIKGCVPFTLSITVCWSSVILTIWIPQKKETNKPIGQSPIAQWPLPLILSKSISSLTSTGIRHTRMLMIILTIHILQAPNLHWMIFTLMATHLKNDAINRLLNYVIANITSYDSSTKDTTRILTVLQNLSLYCVLSLMGTNASSFAQ